MNHFVGSLVVFGLWPTISAADVINDRDTLNTILGDNLVLEDFESFELHDQQGEALDTFLLDSETITNGQGPGLVQPGASYYDPSENLLQWNGNQFFGVESRTLLSQDPDGRLWIIYAVPVAAMGLDLRAFEGFGYDGFVDVYDANDTLLGSVTVTLDSSGSDSVFVGWEDLGGAGIARVELNSPSLGASPIIDNHGYGVPAPGTLSALVLVGLSSRRLR